MKRPHQQIAERYGKKVDDLLFENGWTYKDQHPDYPLEEWREDVQEGNTHHGYWEWVVNRIEHDAFYEDIPM